MINVTVFKIEKSMFTYYAILHLKPYFNQIVVLQNGIETLKSTLALKHSMLSIKDHLQKHLIENN